MDFTQRIDAVKREIAELKSISRKATSALITTSQDVTLTTTITRQWVGGKWWAKTVTDGVAEVSMDAPGFISAASVTAGGPRITGRGIHIWQTSTTSGNPAIRATYWRLTDAELAALTSPAPFQLTIRITATAPFTVTTREEPAA